MNREMKAVTSRSRTVTRAVLDDLSMIARNAAEKIIMPRFGRLADEDIRTKTSPSDLVTVADVLSEDYIAGQLECLLPGALLIGEECCCTQPARIDEAGRASLAVTIDPIDGTANYAAGLPVFGVMLAVLEYGVPVASVIHDPVTSSSAMALLGEGAWMEDRTGGITPVQAARPFARIEEITGKIAWRTLPVGDTEQADRHLRAMTGLWDLRCAAHEYRLVAGGNGHVLAYSRTCLWDHCPGWLLMHEAGAYGARLNGAPYHPDIAGQGLLYAPNPETWRMVHDALSLLPYHSVK